MKIMTNQQESIFGDAEIISCYTRAQAIEDGVLADVSEFARQLYKYPVALTGALWQTISYIPEYASHEDYNGRLWDVLWMSRASGKILHETTKEFKVKMSIYGGSRWLELWAVCGPDDDGKPCITIGYPRDF